MSIEVDQGPDNTPEAVAAKMNEEPPTYANAKTTPRREMAEAADITIDYIVDLKGREYPIPKQSPGVFALVIEEIREGAAEFIALVGVNDIASMLMPDIPDNGTVVSDGVTRFRQRKMLEGLTSGITQVLMAMGQVLPNRLPRIVALILEPDPMRLRHDPKNTTHKTDDVKWEIAFDQQVAVVLSYFEGLKLGELKKVKAQLGK